MQHIHDAMHAMPWYASLGLGLMLAIPTIGDGHTDAGKRRLREGRRQDPIDNVGSWLCLFAIVVLTFAYYW
jgi:hypothetical protein